MRRFELVWVSLASIFMHFINVIRGWFAGRLPTRGMIDLYFYLTLMYAPPFLRKFAQTYLYALDDILHLGNRAPGRDVLLVCGTPQL